MVHFVQQYADVVVDHKGARYVARAYAAPRPDRLWDGWFVFLPLDEGPPLATNWETTQSSLKHVKYWSEAISAVYLEGALKRARARRPEAVLDRRAQRAEVEEVLAREAELAYAQAAAAARAAAAKAARNRRDAEAQLLGERAAAARAAALLQARKAKTARAEAEAVERRRKQTHRRGERGPAATPEMPVSEFPAPWLHRRRG
jgi:hypothetical protein